jgi:hypothetical protein
MTLFFSTCFTLKEGAQEYLTQPQKPLALYFGARTMSGPDRCRDQGDDQELRLRICQICQEAFGDVDDAKLASLLGIPNRQVNRIRAGKTLAAEVLIKLIVSTDANPSWLLSGKGQRFIRPTSSNCVSSGSGDSL